MEYSISGRCTGYRRVLGSIPGAPLCDVSIQAAQLRSVLGVHTGLTLQWYQNADIRRSAETVNRDSIYLHSIFCVSTRVRIGQRMSIKGILRVYSSVGRAFGC